MRFVVVAVAWIACVGGVALWERTRGSAGPSHAHDRPAAAGVFAIEVTASFAAEPDPFALDVKGEKPAALFVRVNGRDALRVVDRVKPGEAIRAEAVSGVLVGRNELLIRANPPEGQLSRLHAIRVRILRDGAPVAEKTFWSEPGTPLAATFALDVPAAAVPEAIDGH